jgi:hypothetical protein
MLSQTLTVTDVCRVTGYTRYQLRGLLGEVLPEKASNGPRVAREFTPHELLVIATVSELETRIGIRRAHIAIISKQLSDVLSGPRLVNRDARLVISFAPPSVSYVSDSTPANDAVVLSLGRIFERVDRYISEGVIPTQAHLNFGPSSVGRSRPRSQSHRG